MKKETKKLEFGTYLRRTFREDGNKLFVKAYSDTIEVVFSMPKIDEQPDFYEELTQLIDKYFKEA